MCCSVRVRYAVAMTDILHDQPEQVMCSTCIIIGTSSIESQCRLYLYKLTSSRDVTNSVVELWMVRDSLEKNSSVSDRLFEKVRCFLSNKNKILPYWHWIPLKPRGQWQIRSPLSAHLPPLRHVPALHSPTDVTHQIWCCSGICIFPH